MFGWGPRGLFGYVLLGMGQWRPWGHDLRGQRRVRLAQGVKMQGAQSPQAPRCCCCSASARSSAISALLSAASSTSVPRLDRAARHMQGAQAHSVSTTASHRGHRCPQPTQ